jgi:hypothetical protein
VLPGKLLGYFWPPHLYQGHFKVKEKSGSVNQRIRAPLAKKYYRLPGAKKHPGGFSSPGVKYNCNLERQPQRELDDARIRR